MTISIVIRFYKNKENHIMERLIRCQTNRISPVALLSSNKYGDSFSIDFVAVSGIVADYNNSKTAVFHVALHCDEREKIIPLFYI